MLDQTRILSVSAYLAGPFASRMLADLGAEVIKVENVDGGDPFRYLKHPYDEETTDDLTYRFLQYNRGKQSIGLDLKTDQGVAIFKSLARKSDVIIENLRPNQMEKMGLGYDTIRKVNNDIVYCSISGFGETGPYRERGGVDPLIQAMSGLVDQNRADAEQASLTGIYIADIIGSMYAAISILAGLVLARREGSGTHIDLSLFDGLVSLLNHEAAQYSAEGSAPPSLSSGSVPQGVFETEDGAIALYIPQKSWTEFCEIIGFRDWIESGELDILENRQDRRDEVENRIESKLKSRPTDEWMDDFLEENILAAPVKSIDDVFVDEAIRHRDIVREASNDVIGSYIELDFPSKFSEDTTTGGEVPRFGEHSRAILSGLGFTNDEISVLYNKGIIDDYTNR